MQRELNILGEPLEPCSRPGRDPITGWRREGYASYSGDDGGCHIIASELTLDFLLFTKARGNPLYKPPLIVRWCFGFSGLEPGDRWALCVSRWLEAERAGKAPPILARATSIKALDFVSKDVLLKYAIDMPQPDRPPIVAQTPATSEIQRGHAMDQ